MARRIVLAATLLLIGSLLLTGPASATGPVLDLIGSDDSEVSVRLAISDLEITPVETDRGGFTSLEIPDFGFTTPIGAPRLPVLRRLVEVPLEATWTVRLDDPMYREIDLPAPVVPQQPPRPKTGEPAPPFAHDPAAYDRIGYLDGEVVTVREVGFVRGHRLVELEIEPVDYDPAGGRVRLLEAGTVRIEWIGADRGATDRHLTRYRSEPFDRIVRMAALNGDRERYLPAGEIGFLVVADPSFTGNPDLTEFLDWKEGRGFHVTFVTTDETGPTKEAIKAYIQNAYDTWAIPPTFVLLVGDTPAIPHWTGSGTGNPATDLNYAMLEGSDYLPDIAVGRFSATNPTQLHNIIAKTLSFERVEWTGNDDWEKHATFMASNDNYTVSEGTHNYVITTYLDPLGYISDRLYCHTYNATTQQVRDAFNAGRSQGTYSGHGSETSWADGPPFNQTDVNNLTNTVYPFVQSYACLTGAFTVAECFGETWTRTAHGAVAFWGSSVTSYWTEDDILEKRLYEGFYADVYPEHPVNQTWVGGMTNYAKLRYYEYFGNSGTTRRYLEMYNILGDPSVDVWTDIPAVADVDAPQTLIAGESGFEMTVVGTPYAMASIRKSDGGNDIFLTAWADPSGHVVVNLPEPLTPGLLSIAVTAHDLEPYFFAIQVIQPEGPYLIFDTCVVDDGSGDGNGIAGAGETIGLDAILENVGIDPATGVTASISAVDPYVEILDADAEYGDIPAGGTAGCIEPFVVAVAGDVPDQHTVTFALHVLANEGEWNAEFGIPVQAPILRVGASLIDDSAPGGNGDGGADPGETFYLQLWLGNVGHRAAGQLEGSLSCENLDVVILDGDGGCLGVPVGGEALLSAFRVEVLPTCPDPATLTLQIALAGADGFAADLECEISVGAFFDDVETDRGWTLSAADDNATSGRWVRGDPVGTTYNDQPCQPEDDHSPGTGIQCFVTANGTPGGAAGDADVDGGKTTLLSPVFALGDALSATVEYWRWYTNDLGNNPGQDYWDVDATADGENWVSLEHTTQSANAWNHYSFNLGDTIPLTDQVRLRFVASDESPGSLVEAAVDDFTLTAVRTPATGVTDAEVTTSLGLVSCHPNPFNPRTSILYSVGAAMRVKVGVYDVAGRIVRTLVDGKVDAGQHTILFDGTDEEGHTVSSGVYFLRMETPEILSIRQVTLLK